MSITIAPASGKRLARLKGARLTVESRKNKLTAIFHPIPTGPRGTDYASYYSGYTPAVTGFPLPGITIRR